MTYTKNNARLAHLKKYTKLVLKMLRCGEIDENKYRADMFCNQIYAVRFGGTLDGIRDGLSVNGSLYFETTKAARAAIKLLARISGFRARKIERGSDQFEEGKYISVELMATDCDEIEECWAFDSK